MRGLSLAAASRDSSLAVVLCLTALTSLVVEHGLSARLPWLWLPGLSSSGARASLPQSMWCLPRPGIELVTPASLKVDSKPLDQRGSPHFILMLPFLTKLHLQYYQICPFQADGFPKALL